MDDQPETDYPETVVFVGVLALVHGLFWLGVGLAAGRLLWGMP